MFKKIFFTLIVLVILAFSGLSAYVSTIDWNKHKNKIAEQFEEISGKKIVFEGPVSLSFFPSPYLSAKDIKIFNQTGENTNQPLAVISEMVTELAWLPLIRGHFTINNMSLLNTDILIEFLPNGKLNWYSEISDFQRTKLDSVEVALNSVLLKDANVQILNKGLNVNVNLQNLNAEITAESLSGPYRIDGNFIKDGNPAGFALNLGTINESFATSLNLVLTHPNTESYARFDGSMLSSNKEIKGNLIIESKQPSNFINELTNQTLLPTKFNYPLACSIELITNEEQIDLASFVIKYGDNTIGAGNILIPLKPAKDENTRKIEAFFEMTDLDLMPIYGIIQEQIKKYNKPNTKYTPQYDFNLIADIKAVKASMNNNQIRNFNFSVDLIDNIITVKDFSGLFPGDTDLSISGDIFEKEQAVAYNFKLKALSQDVYKFFNIFNIKPKTYAQSTYKNASFAFKANGNLQQINISPINITLDKTKANGDITLQKENKLDIKLNADTINFDNYLPKFSEEEQKLRFTEKLNLLLNKFEFLNKYDVNFTGKLNLGIFNGSSFTNTVLQFNSADSVVNINNLDIENLNDAEITFNGELSSLGKNPHFKNMKYTFNTTDFKNFAQKINLPLPNFPLISKARNINAKGILTGDINTINTKSIAVFDNLNTTYTGTLSNKQGNLNFKGQLEFKTPNFVDFVKNIGYNYKPKYMASNIFTYKSNIEGTPKNWTANNIDAFVGSNNFKGEISVINEDSPQINAILSANKFEFNRFVYNPNDTKNKPLTKTSDFDKVITFIPRPNFNTDKIDYEFYKQFELSGKFDVKTFEISDLTFDNFKTDIEINQGLIKIKNITATIDNAPLKGNIIFDINAEPKVKGDFELSNYKLSNFGGKKYEILSGITYISSKFDAPADSVEKFVKGLNSDIIVDLTDALIKGWDINYIAEDINKRTHSTGLFDMLRTNLQSGETSFYNIQSDFEVKNGIASFKDIIMENSKANVTLNGKLNLFDWTINTDFLLKIHNIKENTPPVTYQWDGSISNPNLIITSLSLKNKYDDYWNQIRKKEEAEIKAKFKELHYKMLQAQKNVKEVNAILEEDIFPKLTKYAKMSSNVSTKNKYASSKILADDIKSQLNQMEKIANNNFDDQDIININAKTDVFIAQLDNMNKELDQAYSTDLFNHSNDIFNTINNIYQNSFKKGIRYHETLNTYTNRLIEINSLVILDNNPKIADYKNTIETTLRSIADLFNTANKNKATPTQSDNITDIESQYAILNELLDKMKKEIDVLNSAMQNLFDYAKKIVTDEEEENIKKLKMLNEAKNDNPEYVNIKDTNQTEKKSKIIIIEEGQQPDFEEEADLKFTQTDSKQPALTSNITETPASDTMPTQENKPTTVNISTDNIDISTNFVPANIEKPINTNLEDKNVPLPVKPDGLIQNPFANVTPIVPVQDTRKFKKSQETIQEELPKTIKDNTQIETVKETATTVKPVEAQPLLKLIGETSDFRPKMSTSGIITKPASVKKQKNNIENLPTSTLLKPLTGAEVESSGTITKKK